MAGINLILAAVEHQPEEVSCKLIVYALCGVILTMAGFIVKQFADRISDLKESRDLSDTLLNQVSKDRGTR